MACAPPVSIAHIATAMSLVAQLQRLSGSAENSWGSHNTDHMSRCTQSLVFSKDKNKVGSYKFKISTKNY